MESLGKVFILGDSYSTYGGWVPDGYPCYYCDENPRNGVSSVEQTWWHMLLRETGAEFLRNSSYSGSTICNTGYNGEYCPHKSFIGRLDRLIEDGYFERNRPDTIFIFGGTNDFWAKSPTGDLKYSDWWAEDLKEFLPAFCYLLDRVKSRIPSARPIVLMNDPDIRPVMIQGMAAACQNYGADYIRIGNIDKNGGHPTGSGMEQIKDRIMGYLDE